MQGDNDLRYPIGKYTPIGSSDIEWEDALTDIRHLPLMLEQAILNLDAAQLSTPYRDGGWTLIQLVHHVADSHMNAYVRCKLALTENEPVIKPYDENAWALLHDNQSVPVNISITLLHALHVRWHATLAGLDAVAQERTVFHPERKKTISIREMTGMYAWHGRHHVAHINHLRSRRGW